jgi:hypothetical protein
MRSCTVAERTEKGSWAGWPALAVSLACPWRGLSWWPLPLPLTLKIFMRSSSLRHSRCLCMSRRMSRRLLGLDAYSSKLHVRPKSYTVRYCSNSCGHERRAMHGKASIISHSMGCMAALVCLSSVDGRSAVTWRKQAGKQRACELRARGARKTQQRPGFGSVTYLDVLPCGCVVVLDGGGDRAAQPVEGRRGSDHGRGVQPAGLAIEVLRRARTTEAVVAAASAASSVADTGLGLGHGAQRMSSAARTRWSRLDKRRRPCALVRRPCTKAWFSQLVLCMHMHAFALQVPPDLCKGAHEDEPRRLLRQRDDALDGVVQLIQHLR